MAPQENIVMEGVRIMFRNFSGKADRYNREGDRNFAVVLDPKVAASMERDGFKVKTLQAREEGDDPQHILKVVVKYRNQAGEKIRPPRVVMITSRGRTNLGEDEVSALDWADIVNVDLIIRPFEWTMSEGRSGIAAYLQSIYVTIQEDPLEAKYAEVDENHQTPDGPQFQ
jgi:hypothetical protein